MSSISNEDRVIIIQDLEMRLPSGIALGDDWPETILNTLALNGLILGQHFDWATSGVASLRHLKVRFVWQVVRLLVLWDNFLD